MCVKFRCKQSMLSYLNKSLIPHISKLPMPALDRGTKVGLKVKYNCYMLPIQALKIFIGSWWGDIRARTWSLVKNRNLHILYDDRFLSSKWSILID